MPNDKRTTSADHSLEQGESGPVGLFGRAAAKSDEELAGLALENQGYFLFLLKRYEHKLLRYVLRLTNASPEEAEDILQDVFLKVYQNLNDFDPGLKFSSWIYRITHNQVISNYRRNQARPQARSVELDEETVSRLVSDLDLVEEADRQFLKESINQILGRLDEKYREVLILKFLEEKDYKEISDILKKPMGTISTLINRAKKKFREELEKQNFKF